VPDGDESGSAPSVDHVGVLGMSFSTILGWF
jgi:hypothetical protein